MVTNRRAARINLQPSLASPLLHLSGGSAQQELVDAAAERTRLHFSDDEEPEGRDGEIQESTEYEEEVGPAIRRHNNREHARARLYGAVMECRQFVVLKWLLEILSEGGPTGIWCLLTCLALMLTLGSFQDNKGNSIGTWFNCLVAWKIARVMVTNVVDAGLYSYMLGTGVGGLLVIVSNQMAAFLYHYVIVFIEMAVLVQLGNFSSVGA